MSKGLSEAKRVQALNVELFQQTEGPQSDAWVSDESGTDSLAEFFSFVEGHLAANVEATKTIRAFLRKHRTIRRAALASRLKED